MERIENELTLDAKIRTILILDESWSEISKANLITGASTIMVVKNNQNLAF